MVGTPSAGLITNAREWLRRSRLNLKRTPKIGIALGGGFARGIAHVGVLRAFEKHGIPIHAIAGVSAGSIAAAAYASGMPLAEIESVARGMRFRDVARWTLSPLGLAGTDRMGAFLERLLAATRFEDMRTPLAVVASDLITGNPVIFRDRGDVILPIRASCSYPGLFTPIRVNGWCLVDGMVSMEVPARPLRAMGCTHVISVCLPDSSDCLDPRNLFSVITRSFQILNRRTQGEWQRWSNLVISPQVGALSWNSFEDCAKLIAAGERAAIQALPSVRRWFRDGLEPAPAMPASVPV